MADLLLIGVDSAGVRHQVSVVGSQLSVVADVASEFEHESEVASRSFSWSVVAANFAAAATLLTVQNTSPTLKLHIEEVTISSDANTEADIHTIAAATTPSGGTAVVGRCLNVSAPRVAEAVGHSNDTANSAQGNIIWANRFLAESVQFVTFGGAVILGNGDAIAVDITTASVTFANCNIAGYYKAT